jgi:hypothetical protein
MVFDGQLVSEMSVSLSTEKLSKFRAELAAHKQPALKSQSSLSEPLNDEQQQQQLEEQQAGNAWA